MKKYSLLFLLFFIAGIVNAVNHTGAISSDQTWYSSDNPHVITGNVTVNNLVTLTIEEGCDVRFNGNYNITVNGALHADGTIANPVIFTSNLASPAKGDWQYIYFNNADAGSYMNYCNISFGGSNTNHGAVRIASPAGTVSIDHCFIEKSENYGITESGNGSSISNCQIAYCNKDGIYLWNNASTNISGCYIHHNSRYGINLEEANGTPTISNCNISNNSNYAIYTFGEMVKYITGNMIILGNSNNSIYVRGDYLNSGTWLNHGVPYVIGGNIYVNDAQLLTIQSGCQLKFNGNYRLEVRGSLVANGTSTRRILFTSNQLTPAKGNWRNIYFNNADSGCLLNYCNITYGGSASGYAAVYVYQSQNNVTLSNCKVMYSADHGIAVTSDTTSLTLTNCWSKENDVDGIFVNNTCTAEISLCQVSDNGRYGINCNSGTAIAKVSGTTLKNNISYPIRTFSDNVKYLEKPLTIDGNNPDAIWVGNNDITTGLWNYHQVPYIIGQSGINVLDGNTWTIEEGCQIKMNGSYSLTIDGAVIAVGSPELPVIFTSNNLNPAPGNWTYLYFNNSDPGCLLEHCEISYGGGTNGGIYINNSGTNISLRSCNVINNSNSGIYITNSSPSIINCSFTGNNVYGIRLSGTSTPTFGSNETEWNAVYNNGNNYEFRNSVNPVTAEYIYWGNTNCIPDVDNLIYDDDESASLGFVDYNPTINNAGINFPVETVWTGLTDSDWDQNNNWSNCKPCAEIDAVIPFGTPDDPVISGSAETKDLVIEPGGALTVNPSETLTVYGDLVLQADNNRSASLIDNGGITVNGETKAEFFVDQNRWHYVSSPVSNAISYAFFQLYLKEWQENNNAWFYIEPTNIPLGVGKGWAAWSNTGTTGTRTVTLKGGTINTGTVNLPVTATDINNNSIIGAGEGWNLVGNPYPSAIDWDLAGWTKTNIDGTVYVWDGSQYLTWNGSIGALSNGLIPAMQGFMVKANNFNPALQLTDAVRVHGPAPYKAGLEPKNVLNIKVNGNGFSDQTFIHFSKEATPGFDHTSDAYKLPGISEAPKLFCIADEEELAVNTLPFESTQCINLGFTAGAEAEYTFNFRGLESFQEGTVIFLEDLFTNEYKQINPELGYRFVAAPGQEKNRFVLHFGILGLPGISDPEEAVYSHGHAIYINADRNMNFQVLNLQGSIVYSGTVNGGEIKRVPMETTGIYLIRLTDGIHLFTRKLPIF